MGYNGNILKYNGESGETIINPGMIRNDAEWRGGLSQWLKFQASELH